MNFSSKSFLRAASLALAFLPPAHLPAQTAPAPEAAAPIDLTGYWVSLITEDWRIRMLTAPKGDYYSIPLNAEGRKVADTWDFEIGRASCRERV